MTILKFINIVRHELGLPPAAGFEVGQAERGSESSCVLALAMGCTIGAASNPDLEDGTAVYVMRFPSTDTAIRVAAATGCDWCEPLPSVVLPAALADIACAFDTGEPINPRGWAREPIDSFAAMEMAA
jgi:hypothetical protein